MATEGSAVVVNYDRSQEKARKVVEVIKPAKTRAIPARCDASKTNEVEAMFKTTVNEFGKADILVNNASIAQVILFFATNDSRFIAGKGLLFDGGRRGFI